MHFICSIQNSIQFYLNKLVDYSNSLIASSISIFGLIQKYTHNGIRDTVFMGGKTKNELWYLHTMQNSKGILQKCLYCTLFLPKYE